MWASESTAMSNGRTVRLCHYASKKPLSRGEVVDLWREDATFSDFFSSLLASAPFRAFRWETPPWSLSCLGDPFECVVLDAPALDREPDPMAFAEHFTLASRSVIAFANLGRDAVLVVPRPQGDAPGYGHLAVFLRHAPSEQRKELWNVVGEEMHRRISRKPVWLSTSGAGVPWLHVRLDDRPKYFHHADYVG